MSRFSNTLSLLFALLLTAACQIGLANTPSAPTANPTTRPAATTPARPAATTLAVRSATTSSQQAIATAQQPAPPEGGTAILGLAGQLDGLNPITTNNSTLRELIPLLYDSLLRVDPQTARLQPGLAQSWSYSPNGRQVIFHLPSNLTWSDGSPLTAATVADSLTATEHPALQAFSRIAATDDQTLSLTFAATDCAAVSNLALLPLIPAAEITATLPLGSGPFVVTEQSERSLTLARNQNYGDQAPPLEGLLVRLLQPGEIPIALSEGQFDLVGPLQSPLSGLDTTGFTKITYPEAQLVYLAINYDPKNGGTLPPEVRQALALAVDREAVLAKTLAGEGQLLAGSLLPEHWAANTNLSLPEYDPQAARQLLARAGLRDTDRDGWLDRNGQRVELGIRLNGQNALHQNLGWLLSSYYRELGLLVRAEGVAFDSLVDDLFTHDFNLAIFRWPILPDPDQHLYWYSTENSLGLGLNFTSYRSRQVDELLDEALAVPGCEPDARAEIYGELQAALAQERPVDFLLAPNRHLLLGVRLQGVKPGPFASFTWNVSDWYMQEN